MKYLPHSAEDIREMLALIGVNSLDELYAEVPEELKLHRELNIPRAQSEIEVRRHINELAEQNDRLICFAGAGAYDHYQPSVIPYIAARSEFSTSYTPYQAEISQGTLQYIFEYQTMMADLTGMDVSNASMYDGSTATAEAMMMCVAAAKKRQRVLVSETLSPAVRRVMQTYAKFHGIDLVTIPAKDYVTDVEELQRQVQQDDVAGVVLAQPNRYGYIEDFSGIADLCHAHKTLLAINSVASTLGVLKSPGEWGADIACGDAQSLGLPLGYGGPYIGYLCTKSALIRKMPGRLVGATVDADGKRCFVLTMQAREQHIRREKATSNICTAQGFMCLYVACYLALMGQKGLRQVCEQSYAGAHYLHDRLLESEHFEEVAEHPFLGEFTLRYHGELSVDELRQAMAYLGYVAGVEVEGRPNEITFAVTEKRNKEEIDNFVEELATLESRITIEEAPEGNNE
ncbi:MAG: aminomethyl-transferring glycine dehydrogenase subunit GcvPA [Alloprevotella sp.]